MQDLRNDLKPAPLLLKRHEYPGGFRHVADAIGDDAACSLLWHLPAFQIRHVPTKPAKYNKIEIIKRDYDGTNTATLAGQLNMQYGQVKRFYNDVFVKPDLSTNVCMSIISEMCGNVVTELLLEHFPGHAIHIPSAGKMRIIRNLIKAEFTGNNHILLAAKYGFSIQFIYRVMQEKQSIQFHQFSLFEKFEKVV